MREGAGWLVTALLLVLFVGLRLPELTADPPASLAAHYQDVASPLYDEGWWTANARERVLFGRWGPTGYDLGWVSPVYTGLVFVAFRIAGPTLAAARGLSVALGALALLLLLRAGWRATPAGAGAAGAGANPGDAEAAARATRWRAATAALLWAVAFAPAALGRLALPETAGTCLGLAAVVALLGGRGAATAGLLAGLAALTKPSFVFLLPTVVVGAGLLAARRGRRPLRAAAAAGLGWAIPVGVWAGVAFAHWAAASDILSYYRSEKWLAGAGSELSPGLAGVKRLAQVAIAGAVYRHPLLVHVPGIMLLGAAAWPAAAAAALGPRKSRAPDAVLLFGLWALFGGALVSLSAFQPFRYFLPLVPALAFLAAWALDGAPGGAAGAPGGDADDPPAASLLRWAVSALLLTQILLALLLPLTLPRLLDLAAGGRVDLLDPQRFRLTGFLLEVAARRSLSPFSELPREHAYLAALSLTAAAAIALGLGLAYEGLMWAQWLPSASHDLFRMGEDLARRLPPSARVSPAGTYSLAGRLRFDSAAVLDGRMFDASGEATHFLALGEHPLVGAAAPGAYERRYPGAKHVATYSLGRSGVVYLFRAAEGGG